MTFGDRSYQLGVALAFVLSACGGEASPTGRDDDSAEQEEDSGEHQEEDSADAPSRDAGARPDARASGRDAADDAGSGAGSAVDADAVRPGLDAGSAGPDGPGQGVRVDGNPFAGAELYVNPDWVAAVESSIADTGDAALRADMELVKSSSTAVWLDRISVVPEVSRHLDLALAQQAERGQPVLTVFVVYDLPNRDCAAKASAGELAGSAGAERYRSEFIDAIAAQFRAHAQQRIVAIVEPDSLPNLVTNLSVAKCSESVELYKSSVAYAIEQLSMPHVALYLDAAHSGWLGWENNRTGAAKVFREVLERAGGAGKVRGFATNVANYTALTFSSEQYDLQGNPCRDELTFASELGKALADEGLPDKRFVIDTSRNGRGGIRRDWGAWCNVAGAGLGERPRAEPGAGIDAYYWVKPPGESDGVSDPEAPRYDSSCSSPDSFVPSPQAGAWNHAHFTSLVQNASPPL